VYVSGSYRFTKWFQLGSYYSRFTLNQPVNTTPRQGETSGHIYDRVVTGRFDLNRLFNVKLEGHFMDGYGVPDQYPSGFYGQTNPNGFRPNTNALVVKIGFKF
jgi:hypothetical protein